MWFNQVNETYVVKNIKLENIEMRKAFVVQSQNGYFHSNYLVCETQFVFYILQSVLK